MGGRIWGFFGVKWGKTGEKRGDFGFFWGVLGSLFEASGDLTDLI
jgi:hypothetical protein